MVGTQERGLLRIASREFDAFITADQNLQYQQNLVGFDIGVIVLAAKSNRLEDVLPILPEAEAACRSIQPGEVRVVGQGHR